MWLAAANSLIIIAIIVLGSLIAVKFSEKAAIEKESLEKANKLESCYTETTSAERGLNECRTLKAESDLKCRINDNNATTNNNLDLIEKRVTAAEQFIATNIPIVADSIKLTKKAIATGDIAYIRTTAASEKLKMKNFDRLDTPDFFEIKTKIPANTRYDSVSKDLTEIYDVIDSHIRGLTALLATGADVALISSLYYVK